MGAVRLEVLLEALLAVLLAAVGAVPVKQVQQPSMLDQFGPPSSESQHAAAGSASAGGGQLVPSLAVAGVADRDSPGQLQSCPPRSRCVLSSQCSSADVITYEQPKDIYHPASQYDQQAFTPRFTCGQSTTNYVCCREDGVLPYRGSSSGNPFGFPDDLGTADFHHQDTSTFNSGSSSSSGSGFGPGSSSGSDSSPGSAFVSGSSEGHGQGFQQQRPGSVPSFGSGAVSSNFGSTSGSSASGFGTDSSSSSGFVSGSSAGSDFGSNSGSGPGSFSPGSNSAPGSSFNSGSSTGFNQDSGSNSGFGSTSGSNSGGIQSSGSRFSPGLGSDDGFGSGPHGDISGSSGSNSGFPGGSTSSGSEFPGGFGGGPGSGPNFFAGQGFDIRQEAPSSPNFGGMFPPGMPPLPPGMALPGLGMHPPGPAMFPPGGGLPPPPGDFSSPGRFSPNPPSSTSFPPGSPSSSPSSGGFAFGSSSTAPASGSFTPGTSRPAPARRRLQQVLIRGQQHTLPEFSSVLTLDGGAEAFITHGASLIRMEVRPVPGFARTGRSQTVLVAGRQHVTGEFVFLSDPSDGPIIVTTDGVPGQYHTTGGETDGDIELFVPLPELVMLAADIFRQIGGTISQQGTSVQIQPTPSFQPPPPATISTSLRPPNDHAASAGSGSFGGGQPGSGQPSSFGGGQSGSFGGQSGSFGSEQPDAFGGGESGSFGSGQSNSFGHGQSSSFGGGQPDFDVSSAGGSPFLDDNSYTSFEGESSHGGHSFDGGIPAPGHGHGHGHGHGVPSASYGPPPPYGHGHGVPSKGYGPPPPYGHGHHHHPPHHPHFPPKYHPRPPPYGLGHGYPVHRPLPPPHFQRPYPPPHLPSPFPIHTEVCGLRGQLSDTYASVFGSYSARISSGFGLEPGVADYAAHPWHAAILRRTLPHDPRGQRLGGLQYICGATLVSDDMLVTAAHCVQSERESDLVIRLGEYNLYSDKEELYRPYDANVRAIHVHPDYLSSVYLADIAVLQLISPVPLASLPHVTIACLPGPDLSDDHVTCEAPGWGYDAYKTQLEDAPHALKAVSVRPTPADACEASLQTTLLGPAFHLQEGSFCAVGSHGQDTCLGDGGGGLVCPRPPPSAGDPPRYQLVGVTSWGVHCGDGTPGVYTNVAEYRTWLETIIERPH